MLGVNSYAEELGAPSRHQFSTLFKMKEGDSLRSCNDFKQSSDKTHLMAWCLAEALAEAGRVFSQSHNNPESPILLNQLRNIP